MCLPPLKVEKQKTGLEDIRLKDHRWGTRGELRSTCFTCKQKRCATKITPCSGHLDTFLAPAEGKGWEPLVCNQDRGLIVGQVLPWSRRKSPRFGAQAGSVRADRALALHDVDQMWTRPEALPISGSKWNECRTECPAARPTDL